MINCGSNGVKVLSLLTVGAHSITRQAERDAVEPRAQSLPRWPTHFKRAGSNGWFGARAAQLRMPGVLRQAFDSLLPEHGVDAFNSKTHRHLARQAHFVDPVAAVHPIGQSDEAS
jgi:hypothetical protein